MHQLVSDAPVECDKSKKEDPVGDPNGDAETLSRVRPRFRITVPTTLLRGVAARPNLRWDVSGDGSVTSLDALMILQAAVG